LPWFKEHNCWEQGFSSPLNAGLRRLFYYTIVTTKINLIFLNSNVAMDNIAWLLTVSH
jgi:hypothetical protein